jgi:hypothetical protein
MTVGVGVMLVLYGMRVRTMANMVRSQTAVEEQSDVQVD